MLQIPKNIGPTRRLARADSSPQCSCLCYCMAFDRQPQNVCLNLHQYVIARGAAIYPEALRTLQFRGINIDLI